MAGDITVKYIMINAIKATAAARMRTAFALSEMSFSASSFMTFSFFISLTALSSSSEDMVSSFFPESNALYGVNSRKVGADIYIDDKAMRVEYTREESAFWDDLFENVAGKEDES